MTQQRTAAQMHGFIRAVADQPHPLQTKLSLILTDFEPNRNRQAIPPTEAENVIRTAKSSPIKINFDGEAFSGHSGAIPIGPIVEVYRSKDNGRDIIAAEAVIWNDIYTDVAEHLKVAFAEGISTSWEIYYDESQTVKDANGVEWLGGCVFAGTCVVETPAYGPNRTRLLAIAEKLHERADKQTETIIMALADTGTGTAQTADNTQTQAAQTEDVNALREDIGSVLTVLSNMYEGLYQMLDETYDIEANLVTNDMPSMAEQFTKLVAGITKRFDALKEKAAQAELTEAELTQLKATIAEAELVAAQAAKLDLRQKALAEVGIDIATKQEFYLSMEDDTFAQYVEDLKVVKGSNAKAEVKPTIIPEPTQSSVTITSTSIQELAALIRGNK